MDADRFDAISRRLAATLSRRWVAGTLAGALIVSSFRLLAGEEAAAARAGQRNQRARKRRLQERDQERRKNERDRKRAHQRRKEKKRADCVEAGAAPEPGQRCCKGLRSVAGRCVCDAKSCRRGCCQGRPATCQKGKSAEACGRHGETCDVCQPPPNARDAPPATCCAGGTCSCNGECCAGDCFYTAEDDAEFCCKASGGYVCPDPSDPDNRARDACCEEETCECAVNGIRFGSYRRPGR